MRELDKVDSWLLAVLIFCISAGVLMIAGLLIALMIYVPITILISAVVGVSLFIIHRYLVPIVHGKGWL